MQFSPPIRRAPDVEDDVGNLEPKPALAFYPIDPGIRYAWLLGRLISFFVLLFPGLILLVVALGLSGWARIALLIAVALMAVISIGQMIWPFISYAHWGYALRDHELLIRRGVLIKHIYAVPFSRIQHVDTHSGVIERSFGLANLVVHTAGTMLGSLTVPGLPKEDAEALRDYLSEVGHTHANL